jgi:fumarate reductase subunit D
MTPQEPQQQDRIESVSADSVREQDKIQLVLAYLGCLSLIPFLTVKDSPFVQWHAKQGLVLFGAEMLISIISVVVPPIGCFGSILTLGLLVVSILAILRALKGERWRLPVVADLAEKL